MEGEKGVDQNPAAGIVRNYLEFRHASSWANFTTTPHEVRVSWAARYITQHKNCFFRATGFDSPAARFMAQNQNCFLVYMNDGQF